MNVATDVQSRQTKYCEAIEHALKLKGHATNSELITLLRESFPELSATTVHRATARLAAHGTIGVAPPTVDGSMRYDANIQPHDHFSCSKCGILRDTDIKQQIIPILEQSIGDCSISGRITVSGICKNCKEGE
ncbi:MAG: transcriptional repressor [Candidatus Saccharimonadales bacterium]